MPKDRLAELFKKFPGIGPKQAERFTYFLMKQNSSFVENFILNVKDLHRNSIRCVTCMKFSYAQNLDNKLCNICSNPNRNHKMLMIVEKELDVDSIEKSGLYDGLYFILGGHLPYIADNPRDYINVEELAKLIIEKIKSETLEEIIFALPVNEEGDNEMEYLKGILKQIVGIESIKITHLARGVSTGLEMEYVDKDTFRNAFTLRNPD